jgi:hypothetical protein
MELLNKQVINIPGQNIIIDGNWTNKYKDQKRWEGQAFSEEPMVSITFLECGKKLFWVKSERNNNKNHNITVAIFNYDKTGLDVQFNYTFNYGNFYSQSKIEDINYFPIICTNNTTAGKLTLFCDFEGNPKLKLYCLFIPSKIIKIKRRGIWHIKKEYLSLIDNNFFEIFQYGKNGVINEQ